MRRQAGGDDGGPLRHAKQFKRHRRELRFLRARLGRLIRDFGRKITGVPALEEVFALALSWARQIRSQQKGQRGWKLYSFHAPEVEWIGKGKARATYEFDVKALIVTTNARAPGGHWWSRLREQVLAINRNDWMQYIGMPGRDHPVRAAYEAAQLWSRLKYQQTELIRRPTHYAEAALPIAPARSVCNSLLHGTVVELSVHAR